MKHRKEDYCISKPKVAYVPHGINPTSFFPIPETDLDAWKSINEFKESGLGIKPNIDFIVFFNSRNIRRKNPTDLILAFKTFCDTLPKSEADNCLLLMHTDPVDENGTDLLAVIRALCPMYSIKIHAAKVSVSEMNWLYNIADVTVSIASNEGFGLSSAESIVSGTPVINNVTGGLQDQVRFVDENNNWIDFDSDFASNHNGRYKVNGIWAKSVFPASRSCQGSIPTPYIFDDRVNFEDVAKAIQYWYGMQRSERKNCGMVGREWMISDEAKMSSEHMCNSVISHIDSLFNTYKPKDKFFLYSTDYKDPEILKTGISVKYE